MSLLFTFPTSCYLRLDLFFFFFFETELKLMDSVNTSSGLRTAGCPDDFTLLCSGKGQDLSSIAIAGNDKISGSTC
jgi:hypothetical protein